MLKKYGAEKFVDEWCVTEAATVASSNTPVLKYKSRNAWVECAHRAIQTKGNDLKLDCVHQHPFICLGVKIFVCDFIIEFIDCTLAHTHRHIFYFGVSDGHLRVATKTEILFATNKIGRDVVKGRWRATDWMIYFDEIENLSHIWKCYLKIQANKSISTHFTS